MAADLLAVFDAEAIETGVLVGMGESAALAVSFAAHHGDRLSHLILIDPSLRPLRGPGSAMLLHTLRRSPQAGLKALARTLVDSDDTATAMADRMMDTIDGKTAARLYEVFLNADALEITNRVQTPTLLLYGLNDRMVSEAEGQMIHGRFPDAQLTFLDTETDAADPRPQGYARIDEFLTAAPEQDLPPDHDAGGPSASHALATAPWPETPRLPDAPPTVETPRPLDLESTVERSRTADVSSVAITVAQHLPARTRLTRAHPPARAKSALEPAVREPAEPHGTDNHTDQRESPSPVDYVPAAPPVRATAPTMVRREPAPTYQAPPQMIPATMMQPRYAGGQVLGPAPDARPVMFTWGPPADIPEAAVVLNRKGIDQLLMGDIEAALSSFQQAIELAPNYNDAAVNHRELLSRLVQRRVAEWQTKQADYVMADSAKRAERWAKRAKAGKGALGWISKPFGSRA